MMKQPSKSFAMNTMEHFCCICMTSACYHLLSVFSMRWIIDEYEPLEEGLERRVEKHSVPSIVVLLTLNEAEVDKSYYGYQAPLDESLVEERDYEEVAKRFRKRCFSMINFCEIDGLMYSDRPRRNNNNSPSVKEGERLLTPPRATRGARRAKRREERQNEGEQAIEKTNEVKTSSSETQQQA